jgi:hypothetical protein
MQWCSKMWYKTMKSSKRFASTKMYNLDDGDTIKDSGPGSPTTNRNGSKNDSTPEGSTKANI